MRYDRIERLWSQVREVGISSIEGYSGDEAGQWLPSNIFKFVLGNEQLSKCINIPVVAKAISLAFNAAYFEELFGLGWSEFDYLRLAPPAAVVGGAFGPTSSVAVSEHGHGHHLFQTVARSRAGFSRGDSGSSWQLDRCDE